MAKNRPDGPTEHLTADKVKVEKDSRGRDVITLPGPEYESDQTLGDIIAEARGEPLDGGPLNVIGV